MTISDRAWDIAEHTLEYMLFVEKKCPDCGKFDFLEGPRGGLAVNIKCTNCGSEFNVCPPWFAEQIGLMHNTRCLQCGEIGTVNYLGICRTCTKQNREDQKKIAQHIKDGHTEHCAKRLVWGDGECECKAFPEKRDPMEELVRAIRRLQKKEVRHG